MPQYVEFIPKVFSLWGPLVVRYLQPLIFYRLPTNCVHRRRTSSGFRPYPPTPSCRPVPFNKIMPAGEHMAVQNFITPFMAFQHYDVGLHGAEWRECLPSRFLSANIYWCQREWVWEGCEGWGQGSRWQSVGEWYVLVFKTRSSAINSPTSKRLTRSDDDAFDQRVTYVSHGYIFTGGGGGRGESGATLSIKIFTMCRKLLNFLATQTDGILKGAKGSRGRYLGRNEKITYHI